MIKKLPFLSLFLTMFCLLLGGLTPHIAQAQSSEEMMQHAEVTLLPSAPYFEAGQTYRLGVLVDMEPEWHIYWRYGGETGLPPEFIWSLPDDFAKPEISWPRPEYIEYNTIINYGYHDETVLFADINVPADYQGDVLDIDLDFEWLICKEICVPEFGNYKLSLPSKAAYDGAPFAADPRLDSYWAQVPQPLNGDVNFEAKDFTFTITLNPDEALFSRIMNMKDNGEKIFFAPYNWGWMKNSSEPSVYANQDEQTVSLRYPRGRRMFDTLENAAGVLVFSKDGKSIDGYEISGEIQKTLGATQAAIEGLPTAMPNEDISAAPMELAATTADSAKLTLFSALAFAFIGGLILNLMPCVFPILSLKALSLIKHANEPYKVALSGGFAYSAGVILSFVAIAALMIALQSGGAQIGWGFQLQDRNVLYVLTLLMFLIALSLIGALNINQVLPSKITNIGQNKANNEGLSGAFFTGLLATLVAAPCTAPFMAGALGFAATQPAFAALSIFAMLGAGLAFPYFILCAIPALRKALPKPGAWMEGFRQFLAFPMFATVIWLGLTLVKQDNYLFLMPLLSAVLAVAFAVWLIARQPKSLFGKGLKGILMILALSLIILTPHKFEAYVMNDAQGEESNKHSAMGEHAAFSQDALKRALASDASQPIFVYLTADWCITCKVNERRVLNTDDITNLFAEHNVLVFKGDWTKRNSDITEYLTLFDRNGVPLYVYYGPADPATGVRPAPVILPQLLSFNHFTSLF